MKRYTFTNTVTGRSFSMESDATLDQSHAPLVCWPKEQCTVESVDLTAEIAARDARIQALRTQLDTLRDFDVDAATLVQLKPFLKLQRSILLKMAQLLKGAIEGAE